MPDRLIIGVIIAVALAVAPAVSASAPRNGAFKGTVSYKHVPVAYNGFNDPVMFSVAPNGGTVTDFSFGFFSCSGVGGAAAPGKNYWLSSLKKVAAAPLSKTGSFTGSGTWSHSQKAPVMTDTVKYTIRGTFNKAGTMASGTIAVNENLTGHSIKTPPNKANCAVYSFSATHA